MSKAAPEPMAFNLAGPGVQVSYRSAGPELDLDGSLAGLSYDNARFEAEQLGVEETEIGSWVSAHLLTTRAGWEIELRLLVPRVTFDEDEDESDVTAVALITTDSSSASAGPSARCQYDVRQLHGTVSRAD